MALRQRAKKAHAKGANAGPNKTGAALSGGGGGAEASPFGKAADTLGSTTASLLIFLLAFGLHVNTLEGEFVYDDARGVVENGDVTQANAFADLWVNDFWGKPMERYQSHKSYRPLTVLTFRMNHHLHGLDPFGFHVTNVVLHGIVCVLFLRASAVMIGRLDVAFVAALLFTAHSIHTEAVANVVGRAELLSGMFVMLAFLAYHQAASAHKGGAWAAVCLGGSMLFAAAAMLCKEQGITVLGLVAAYDAMVLCSLHPFDVPAALAGLSAAKHSGLQFRYAVITVTGVALLAFRVKMMGEGGPIFNEYELPALGCKDPTTRALTFNYYAAFNFHLLALPLSQSSDWSYSSIPLVESIADQRFATTGATYAGVVVAFVALVLKARSASGAAGAATGSSRVTMAALLGFVWMLVAYVPSSNLFFNVGFVIAERILYLPRCVVPCNPSPPPLLPPPPPYMYVPGSPAALGVSSREAHLLACTRLCTVGCCCAPEDNIAAAGADPIGVACAGAAWGTASCLGQQPTGRRCGRPKRRRWSLPALSCSCPGKLSSGTRCGARTFCCTRLVRGSTRPTSSSSQTTP